LKQKIAIFDIDNTILSVDSFLKFIFFIFKNYPFKIINIPYLIFIFLLRLLNIISIEKLKEKFLNILLSDLSDEEIKNLTNNFINKVLFKKIKPKLKNYITELKSNGFHIIFATASLEFYIKDLATFFSADAFVATQILRKDNIFYIKGKNCKDIEKIFRLKKILNVEDIDRENSIAYSDSITDIFFLELCKKFYLVDRKKWKILKEYTA